MGKDNFTDTIIAEKVRIERKVQNYCAEIYFGKKILEKSSKAAFEKKIWIVRQWQFSCTNNTIGCGFAFRQIANS